MQIKTIVILSALVLTEWGCKKINYFPDQETDMESPVLLAHRGGKNATYRENTLEGIKAALRHMGGVEVDVQVSKDETVWLSHSADVVGCQQSFKCFPESRDADLKTITTCNGEDISYTELEDVYQFMHDSFPKAYISIDLKGWFPCSGNSADIEGMMRREAKVITEMAVKYGLEKNTLIETETSSVLLYVKSLNTNVGLYQTSYGEFERGMLLCLNYGMTGISYKMHIGEDIDKEKMDMLHRKGLKLMAWNLSSKEEAPSLVNIGVDYIQVDL